VIKSIDKFLIKYSYLTFLISLIIWIGLSPVIEIVISSGLVDLIMLNVIIISSYYFFYHSGNKIVSFILVPISALITWLSYFLPDINLLPTIERIIMLLLFLFITIHLIVKIFKSKSVDENVIYASIAGYIMIGLMASILCWVVNWLSPNSYNIPYESGRILDFAYYSFVTMSTLGYGDVTPINEASRSLAIFITLIGQFYMTVLIALLIGKFISQKNQE